MPSLVDRLLMRQQEAEENREPEAMPQESPEQPQAKPGREAMMARLQARAQSNEDAGYYGGDPTFDAMVGAVEAPAYMLWEGLKTPLYGLYGVGKGIATGSLENVFRGQQEAQEFGRAPLRTKSAPYNLQMLADILKPVEEFKQGLSETTGSVVSKYTDNPYLLGLNDAWPDVLEFFAMGKGTGSAISSAKRRIAATPEVLTPAQIERIVFEEGHPVEGFYDKKLAPYDVETTIPVGDFAEITLPPGVPGKPRTVIPDDAGRILYEEYNIPKTTVSFIKTVNPATLQRMRELFDVRLGQRQRGDLSGSTLSRDIIGESLAERIGYLGNIRSARGKQLEKLVSGPAGRQTMSTNDIVGPWVSMLMNRLNVQASPMMGNDGILRMNWRGSKLSETPAAQDSLNNLLTALQSEDFTFKNLHYFKGRIDRMIDPATSPQAGNKGIDNDVQTALLALRDIINTKLSSNNPLYGEINGEISNIIGLLDPLVKKAGLKVNLVSPEGIKNLATLTKRLNSNTQSRAVLSEVIPGIVNYVDAIAPNVFKDDVMQLIDWSNRLEARFGSETANSIGGIMEKTQSRTASNVAGALLDASTGNMPGIVAKSLEGAKNLAVKTEDLDMKAMLALNKYLRQLEAEHKAQQKMRRSRRRGQQR